jgi:hypothetical protein
MIWAWDVMGEFLACCVVVGVAALPIVWMLASKGGGEGVTINIYKGG